MDPCELMDNSKLAAWVDSDLKGSPQTEGDDASSADSIAAHVAGCCQCAARVVELRVYAERMRRYRVTTTPDSLTSDFWHKLRKGMDRQDQERTPARPAPLRRVPVLALAGVIAIFLGVLALAVLWPHPFVPVSELLNRPAQTSSTLGDQTLVTDDADRAARWLSEQLGAELPPVNLALSNTRLVNAQANSAANTGMMLFRNVQGVPLVLHFYLHARVDPNVTRSVSYESSRYQVAARASSLNTLVLWESDGHTFAAVAPLPLNEFLPYVHQMSRRCRPDR